MANLALEMFSFNRNLTCLGLTACALSSASAVTVHVEIRGSVDFNVIGGSLSGVGSGDPVSLSFQLDSESYMDSTDFPVRGYAIDPSSVVMTVGGNSITFDNPQPATPYFVIRDNDPAVDGFYFASGGVDWPSPLSIHVPGVAPTHDLDFLRTFSTPDMWDSLNILDAVGTYGFEHMSSYQWTIGRFGNAGAEFVPEQISIQAVPEPASIAALGLGALALLRRRKARRAQSNI